MMHNRCELKLTVCIVQYNSKIIYIYKQYALRKLHNAMVSLNDVFGAVSSLSWHSSALVVLCNISLMF